MSDLAKDPRKIAHDQNLDFVLPAPNKLFIDLDDAADLERVLLPHLKILEDNGVYMKITKTTVSPGGNQHVYIECLSFSELTNMQRIAFQACLGSDRKRELLSILRDMMTARKPTVFFEKKGDA